ncbi:MAG TPA: hypothetical protein VF395_10125 [Polyangiaceae bacterium]
MESRLRPGLHGSPGLDRRRWARLALAALGFSLCACHRRDRSGSPAPSSTQARAPASGSVPGFPVPLPLAQMRWETYENVGSLGIPAGCNLEMPVRRARLPKGTARYFAPPGGTLELLLGIDEDGDGSVDRDGVIGGAGIVGRPLPWTKLDAPPIVAEGATGFLAFDAEDTGLGARRGVLWRDPGLTEALIDGDRLDIVDASCDGTTCVVLTTLASASAGPGATLLVGDPHTPASSWTRTDLPGGDLGLSPFSVVRVENGVAWVALAASNAVEVFRVEKGRAESQGRLDAPFGAYDVVVGDAASKGMPIGVAPGESIEERCKKDGFPIRLLRTKGNPVEIDGQVPPTSVLTRPLSTGFFVAWLSPISCKHEARELVRAFLVNADGTPASSAMAVSDAQGFALATHGDSVSLWLTVGQDLIWVNATCRVGTSKGDRKK